MESSDVVNAIVKLYINTLRVSGLASVCVHC